MTWQTAASLYRILPVVSDYAQHTVVSWMYRAINAVHSAGGRCPLLNCAWNSLSSVGENEDTFWQSLKHCFWTTLVCMPSALEVFYDNALYTYLLIGTKARHTWFRRFSLLRLHKNAHRLPDCTFVQYTILWDWVARMAGWASHVVSLSRLSQSTLVVQISLGASTRQRYPLPVAVNRNCFVFVLSFITDN